MDSYSIRATKAMTRLCAIDSSEPSVLAETIFCNFKKFRDNFISLLNIGHLMQHYFIQVTLPAKISITHPAQVIKYSLRAGQNDFLNPSGRTKIVPGESIII